MGSDTVTEIALKSSNLDDLKAVSKKVEAVVAATPGVLNIQNTLLAGGYKAEVVIDPELAYSRGFTADQISELLSDQISGKKP